MKMKIKRRGEEEQRVSFESLEPGQLFEYANRLMIKMGPYEDDDAFDIDNNITVIIYRLTQVLPLNATLTVEE
jgi:hypothetical protein